MLPVDTPKHMRRLARTVHLAMYTCLAMIAVTGLVIGALYGGGIKSGVSMELALIAHEIFVITTYWLIIGHVAAAIFHRRRNDGIWSSMVPLWKKIDKCPQSAWAALLRSAATNGSPRRRPVA